MRSQLLPRNVQVLRDCHFAVPPGQLHMLLGANGCVLIKLDFDYDVINTDHTSGDSNMILHCTYDQLTLFHRCGKSTLLRVAGGLLQPDAGAVVTAQPAGFVFQNPDHQVVLPTAGADVAFGLGRCAVRVRCCAARVARCCGCFQAYVACSTAVGLVLLAQRYPLVSAGSARFNEHLELCSALLLSVS